MSPSPLTSKPVTGPNSAVTSRWLEPSGFMSQTFFTPLRSEINATWLRAVVGASPVVKDHDWPAATWPSMRLTVEAKVTE